MVDARDDFTHLLAASYDGAQRSTSSIPESLPLLEHLDQQTGATNKKPLSGWKCVLVHHLLGSVVPLVQFLRGCGIAPQSMLIIGKAYSTHPAVLAKLSALGYDVHDAIESYSTERPYERSLERTIAVRLPPFLSEKGGPILVLDDGGKALRFLIHSRLFTYLEVRGVELTSRGANMLKDLRPPFPTINVARSQAKLDIEARIIAISMVRELTLWLRKHDNCLTPSNLKPILRGFGALGTCIALELRALGYHPLVSEVNEERRSAASQAGFQLVRIPDHLNRSRLVLSSTGTSTFDPSWLSSLLPGTALVSMGSSDLEYSPWRFHNLLTPLPFQVTGELPAESPSTAPWRHTFAGVSKGTAFHLANGGFPIDFSGTIDPIPPILIQITRSLLLAGALQAPREVRAGLIPLDSEIQKELLARFLHLLKSHLASSHTRPTLGPGNEYDD